MKPISKKYRRLFHCIALDAVGMVSATIPIIDVIWAPIAASISYRMFGDKRGKYTSIITFVEEILPVTDLLPTFTIFWLLFDFLKIGNKNKEQSSATNPQYVHPQ